MDLITIKAISLGGVLFISLVLGVAPLKFASIVQRTLNVERRRLYKRLISFLSCYGGGVFLGASLLDLLPDVRETFDTLNLRTQFPIVEFVVSIGFFIVFIVEQIVLAYKENTVEVRNEEQERLIGGQHENEATPYAYNKIDDGSFADPGSINDNGHDHSNLMFSVHEDPSSHSTLRTLILLMALSLHSIFEGLAIGLQTVGRHLMQLLIAVVIHKGIIALSLGVNLAQTRFKLKVKILFVTLFSCASPIGIGIGMGIENFSYSTNLVNGILQGFACGTFLYVTFFEIIPHELNHKRDRLLKLLFIIIGFATVCGAIYLDISPKVP